MEVASARPRGELTPRVLLAVMALLAAVLAGLVATSVVLGLRVWDKRQLEAQRQDVLHAARQESVNLFSLDYRTLDRDIDRILGGATGKFRSDFASRTKFVEQYLPKAKSVSSAKVHSAGLVSMDEDSAEALVVADARVRKADQKQDLDLHYRLSLTLERHGERWLVSQIRYVG